VCLDPEKGQIEFGTTINRPGASGTEKDQESLSPKKTRRVWDQRTEDQECLRLSGTGREETRRVWNLKRGDQENLELEDQVRLEPERGVQESLEPEERSTGESGT
jgi:hypothetical protein